MQQGLKKITAFILVLLVAMPVFFSLEFMLEEKLLHEEAAERSDAVTLQTIHITTSALYWIRKGKEVMIDGKLFDVKTCKTTNDIVTLTGHFDTKETELREEFNKYIEHSSNDAPLRDLAFKFLFFPVYTCPVESISEGHWHYVSSQYFPFDEMIPVALILLTPLPPRLYA